MNDTGGPTTITGTVTQRIAAARSAGGPSSVLACDAATRLPITFLAGRELAEGRWRLTGLPERSALALALLGLDHACGVPVPDALRPFLSDPPFQLSVAGDGCLTVSLMGGQPVSPRIEQEAAHAWIHALAPASVVIDLGRIAHLTSVVIAWMLQITQGAKPAPVKVVRAAPMVIAQLRQLRLNYLMALE